MRLSALARYPASADRVASILADQAFFGEALADEERLESSASVAGAWSGPFTVSIRHRLAVENLPAQFRHLVPRGLDMRQVNAWEAPGDGGGRQGTVAVDIVGAPLKLLGTMTLTPLGPTDCEHRYAIDLTATIPIVGARIEQAASEIVQRTLDGERRAVLARLTS